MNSDSENSIFKIHDSYITLGQVLKHFNLISTGGEAKLFLNENDVYVNMSLERRRGRKIYPGDKVTYLDKTYLICLSEK